MSLPFQAWRFESSLTPSTVVNSSRIISGEAAPTNHHLGKQIQLAETFQIYSGAPLQNNMLRINPPAAAEVDVGPIANGSYSGAELATAVQTAMQAHPSLGGTYECSYSTTTRLFTFTKTAGPAFEIHWPHNAITSALAYTMGFDAADDTGATTYNSDTEVYSRNYQFAIWRFATTNQTIRRVMVSGTNLASVEQIEVYINNTNLGELPTTWSTANWVGTPQSATQSRTNDTYVWRPDTTIGQYLAIFVNRSANLNQDVQDPFKIGSIGIWTAPGFDGADYGNRTIRSVFETNRVPLDQYSEAALGGNLEIGKIRGYRETTMNFGSWPEGAFYALDTYIDRYRAEAHLFLLDPDDVDDEDKVIFGYIPAGGYGPVRGRDTTHVRDFPLTIRTLRMAPEE